MNEKLELLRKGLGSDFIMIDDSNYKNSEGDALILNEKELIQLAKERIKEEIPYIDNEILKTYLPKKFNNDFILNEYKELCKFDHTLLSNLIINELGLYYEVVKSTNAADIILAGSELTEYQDHYIFYLKTEF